MNDLEVKFLRDLDVLLAAHEDTLCIDGGLALASIETSVFFLVRKARAQRILGHDLTPEVLPRPRRK